MQHFGPLELAIPDELVKILSVGCSSEDNKTLQDILGNRQWRIEAVPTTVLALKLLRRNQFTLIVCEQKMAPDSWKDFLNTTACMPQAPLFILTSLHADDRLWCEALNLGAYDLLMTPFDRMEVKRTFYMAWLHWKHQRRSGSLRVRAAG